MAPAWLDSLSEDWVSQPGSDTSVHLPSLPGTQNKKPQRHEFPSRIPRRTDAGRSSLPFTSDPAANVLSERSANEINIAAKQRAQSKLSQELKAASEAAGSRACSVVHHTVNHHVSPTRDTGDTPEWKRRLVYGNVQYGEQRDLFSSAAVGLQDIFKPPAPNGTLHEEQIDESRHEMTLPSSPPAYLPRITSPDVDFDDGLDEDDESQYPADITPSPSPRRGNREIKYNLNSDFTMSNGSRDFSVLRDQTPIPRAAKQTQQDESALSTFEGNTRKTSGLSDTRNEDFSPILIGKQSDVDGKIDFAPIELPADQLKQRLENLRINQMLMDSEADVQQAFDSASPNGSVHIDNTDDYARNGGFINFKRGGRSAEGSFRFRPLSPGLGVDSSEMLPEESLQASTPKQFPTIRTQGTVKPGPGLGLRSPSMPRAPFPSPEKRSRRQEASSQSGGSPLKLFEKYDTFTNQTLLRRISQFEEGMSPAASQLSQLSETQNPASGPRKAHESTGLSSPLRATKPSPPSSGSVSQFGAGELDQYEFNGDLSHASDGASVMDSSVDWPQLPRPQGPFFQAQPSGSSPDGSSQLRLPRRRHKSLTSSASKSFRAGSMSGRLRHSISLPKGMVGLNGGPKRDPGSEGKRPRTSPSKDPTPKRRRTLHRSDIAFGRDEQLIAVDMAHQQFQSAMGKKRKDARPGDFELADAEVMASRSVLQPCSPTLRQWSGKKGHRSLASIASLDLDSPGSARRGSPLSACLSDDTQPGPEEEVTNRKPSILTQDFVDQAAQIMAMIRSQVRPPGLASVEESVAENGLPSQDMFDSSGQDSTNEPFSRPPSREGKPMPRPPNRQDDPELVNRLKKYQELSDMGDLITSSMRSVGFAKDAILTAQQFERQIQEPNRRQRDSPLSVEGDVISDLANVRISTNPAHQEGSRSPSKDFPTHSSAHSTSRSYPTTSSRGSDSRRIIMPESVSHLIPERVGSMFLDKQNNIWIKKKGSQSGDTTNVLPSEDSEDDPFASIPDLTVDLTREMQNLRMAVSQRETQGQHDPETRPSSRHSQGSRSYVTLSPNQQLSPDISVLAREEFEKLDAPAMNNSMASEARDANPDDASPSSSHQKPIVSTRRRNMTISFSSPIASIIHEVMAEDLDSLEDDPDDWNLDMNRKQGGDDSIVDDGATKTPRLGSRTSSRPQTRAGSMQDTEFIPRPVSRIDEQDEESTVEIPAKDQRQLSIIGETSIISHKTPNVRRASLSFIVNHTPGNRSLGLPADDSIAIGQNVGKLSLSPLSEFTLNNSDQSFGLEVSYVMGRRHLETGNGSRKVMAMTIRELVGKLSEVEPCEPFWEDLTQLDLHDKRLTSLHTLDEFCGKLVTLDASHNALGHLEGVPPSVRHLKVTHNLLTELTSWDHLANLQYIDISGNEIRSLSALKNLVHLRSIKADDNQLTSLDGLDVHDGLLSLRARNNLIEHIDFAAVNLPRVTELDLGGNLIQSIRNLDRLPSLTRLKVPKNKLRSIEFTKGTHGLREIDVNDNELTSLDVANLINLHSLHADRNRLAQLTGFQRARRLDSLSLREQQGDGVFDVGFLSTAYEVRKLFLSGNYLGTFEPRVDFLNLQLLELANCGLQALPEKLGQLMPNLRTLNMNFNAVSDLSPLQYIPRLKKLLAAGNRLTDSTSVIKLLTEFPHLTQLDLRDNPVTLGLYGPIQVLVVPDQSSSVDPFTLPDGDVERDEQYAKRLDEATKLRRRLHQAVFVSSCKRLRKLDGLPVRREVVLRRDELMQSLIAEGVVPEPEKTGAKEEHGLAQKPTEVESET
ncbi:hypothetical protein B0I35DRAFT_427809 [Stachybotrys elegans]|uniref:Septation initiation network scaffold protein cdc11 n=1 Tax=Stachybotrys elegans TaxID=80388 RepID=A0A8K0SU75_9HYPO|nr:hypothetical protein B0I35DRAFT_427809 [Stachybotrys elegans]